MSYATRFSGAVGLGSAFAFACTASLLGELQLTIPGRIAGDRIRVLSISGATSTSSVRIRLRNGSGSGNEFAVVALTNNAVFPRAFSAGVDLSPDTGLFYIGDVEIGANQWAHLNVEYILIAR